MARLAIVVFDSLPVSMIGAFVVGCSMTTEFDSA
jgi:hypothetical protein